MSSIETQFLDLQTHHAQYSDIDPRTVLRRSASGKTIFLSGASRGIGQATAVAFAQAGAKAIYITARSGKALEETKAKIAEANLETQCAYAVCDVTDANQVKAAIEDCVANSAASMPPTPTPATWTNGARSANRTSKVGGNHGKSISKARITLLALPCPTLSNPRASKPLKDRQAVT